MLQIDGVTYHLFKWVPSEIEGITTIIQFFFHFFFHINKILKLTLFSPGGGGLEKPPPPSTFSR